MVKPYHEGYIAVRPAVRGRRECVAFKNFALCRTLPSCWDEERSTNFVFK